MENEHVLEQVSTQLGQNATVKNVYGTPIQTGEKTIIPVAQITYGFGGGFGQGHNGLKKTDAEGATALKPEVRGEGAGGGGGLVARPKGVYEISPRGTRFIPATNWRAVSIGILVGFFLRGMLRLRSKH